MKTLLAQFVFGSLSAVCLITQRIDAQSYSIDWHQVAGGGGTSTSGTYSITGTIGQPDAGVTLTGGGYSLVGGFWSLVSAVQTTGGPTLFISYTGDNVTVYWQAQNGWILQENPNLNAPAGWTNSLELVTVNGVSFHSVANASGALFFRLKR
jgi:hypothetical protein